MAMTKAEKAAMAAAIERAELLAALRWTCPVEPDLPVPDMGRHTQGWLFNGYSKRVEAAWSTSSSHGTGEYALRSSGSQRGVSLYSTRLKAMAAMRHEIERMTAKDLMAIDRKMAEGDAP